MRKMRDEIPPDAGAIRSPAPVWYISWLGPRSDLDLDLDFFYLFSFVCGARNTEFPQLCRIASLGHDGRP